MIGIISSTIFPESKIIGECGLREESLNRRIDETLATVESLKTNGIKEIYLFDNSPRDKHRLIEKQFGDINVFCNEQYQFTNRGTSECFLLLNALKHIPAGQEILKISGRYRIEKPYLINADMSQHDLAGKTYRTSNHKLWFSTRSYRARDRDILNRLLVSSLNYLYYGSRRLTGATSAIRILANAFVFNKERKYHDPGYALEFLFAKSISIEGMTLLNLPELGITGTLKGNPDDIIIE